MKTLLLFLFPVFLFAQDAGINYADPNRDTTVVRIVDAEYTDRLCFEVDAEQAASLFKTLGVEWRKELRSIVGNQIRARLNEVRGQVLATEATDPRTGTKAEIRASRSEAIRTIYKQATVGTAASAEAIP